MQLRLMNKDIAYNLLLILVLVVMPSLFLLWVFSLVPRGSIATSGEASLEATPAVQYLRDATMFSLIDPNGPPLPDGELVTLPEAQNRVSYVIPLPSYLPDSATLIQVWVSPINEQVVLMYSNRMSIYLGRTPFPPDWDRIIAEEPVFTGVSVNGGAGMGTDPGFHTVDGGEQFFHPGSVGWWVGGLSITVYSDSHSLQELLRVAESIEIQATKPTPK